MVATMLDSLYLLYTILCRTYEFIVQAIPRGMHRAMLSEKLAIRTSGACASENQTEPTDSLFTESPSTNFTDIFSENATAAPFSNFTGIPANATEIPSTNSTGIFFPNTTEIPSTNSTGIFFPNTTEIPSGNGTNFTDDPFPDFTFPYPSTNFTFIPSTNLTVPFVNETGMWTNTTGPPTNATEVIGKFSELKPYQKIPVRNWYFVWNWDAVKNAHTSFSFQIFKVALNQ